MFIKKWMGWVGILVAARLTEVLSERTEPEPSSPSRETHIIVERR